MARLTLNKRRKGPTRPHTRITHTTLSCLPSPSSQQTSCHRGAAGRTPPQRGSRWRCPLQRAAGRAARRSAAGGPTRCRCAPRRSAPAGMTKAEGGGEVSRAICWPSLKHEAAQPAMHPSSTPLPLPNPTPAPTSSKISSTPCLSHSARSAPRNPGGGVRKPPSPRIGSRMIAAVSCGAGGGGGTSRVGEAGEAGRRAGRQLWFQLLPSLAALPQIPPIICLQAGCTTIHHTHTSHPCLPPLQLPAPLTDGEVWVLSIHSSASSGPPQHCRCAYALPRGGTLGATCRQAGGRAGTGRAKGGRPGRAARRCQMSGGPTAGKE